MITIILVLLFLSLSLPARSPPALCPPTNLSAVVDCSTSSLSLSWASSPTPGARYTLTSQKLGRANSTMQHSTGANYLSVTGLQCGEKYAFRVAAAGDAACNSTLSPPLEMNTGGRHGNFKTSRSSLEIYKFYIYIYSFSRRFYPKRLPRGSFTKVHRSLIITTR